ncbi:MAG: RNase H family protein [Bacteroidota bacterium]
MLVTINTDASWSPKNKVGTFAFWVVSNQGKIAKAGLLKGEIRTPDHAELSCIANAIHCLMVQKWGITKIIINTDSLNSIHILNDDKKLMKWYGLKDHRFQVIRKVILQKLNGVKFECRHIKSHQNTATPRAWVNEWCDQEAKKQLIKWHKNNKKHENTKS